MTFDRADSVSVHPEMLARLGISIASFDSRDRCISCTRLFADHVGREPETMEDLFAALGLSADDAARLREAIGTARRQGDVRLVTINRPCPDGRCLALEAGAFRSEKSGRDEISVVIRNMSALTEARRRMAEAERLATVGRVTAGVAHEFNNIITAILGWAQIAGRETSNRQAVEETFALIEQNARRARDIAATLSGIARPSTAEFRPVLLAEVVEDVLKLLSWDMGKTGISFVKRIEAVPPCPADSGQLAQVLVNLIRNAMDAMPTGGTLGIAIRERSGEAEIEVSDTGHGMDPDTAKRIFDPFFSTRTDEAGRATRGGSGLGLAVCREIVENHGGRIRVDSAPGRGSTFTISLPLSSSASRASRPSWPSQGAWPGGLRVLVVDDERDIGEMVRTALALKGIDVVMANSGDEALAHCRTSGFDVAFVDLSMPGLSGHALADALRGACPGVSLVFMSGLETDERGSVAGHFIRKPFDVYDIQRKLIEVLDAKQAAG